jgi:hypothetical protein
MPKPELEDYYYISDRKIDNYAAQISPGLAESLSAEIKADLGVVSSKLSTREPRTDRITRMRVVRDYIEKHYEIGKIDSPQLWVKDELSVQDIRLAANPEVMLLMGHNARGELCALAGSSRHIVGNRSAEQLDAVASYFPDFARYVTNDIRDFDRRDVELDIHNLWEFNGTLRDSEVNSVLYCLQRDAKQPKFKVRFLARRIYKGKNEGIPMIRVFTPLYVTLL